MKIFLAIAALLIQISVFAGDFDSFSTTLVACEESENSNYYLDTVPFSEGVYDAMWESSGVFFDIRVYEPLNIVDGQLDVKPYLTETRAAGADSLLLIKFNYESKMVGTKLNITIKEIYYNLYSLNDMKSIRVGKRTLNIDKTIELRTKDSYLKQLGIDTIQEIYK
ncbi:MAG TPA: hypothetical protein PLG34_04110 [Spirochaetota bacterium]|jgi:hypothetical protein|nr:MAG: hypothetical protein BWX91_00539 [Spirochaetes bacterium ADurb.Bin133]HNZ26931.1 hypothetical protein [Spirochaetota bacterium]HPY87147.1 hypothetical protein [Spirochaetota bacterium]HQB60372.1 hypothetical protein [Spirochaetota bacterium]